MSIQELTAEDTVQLMIEALAIELVGSWYTADLTSIEETREKAVKTAHALFRVADQLGVVDELQARAEELYIDLRH